MFRFNGYTFIQISNKGWTCDGCVSVVGLSNDEELVVGRISESGERCNDHGVPMSLQFSRKLFTAFVNSEKQTITISLIPTDVYYEMTVNGQRVDARTITLPLDDLDESSLRIMASVPFNDVHIKIGTAKIY